MTIKHLVFSGGGPIMLQILGAIQEIEKKNFFDLNNIESIYGTSAGAIIGVLICLKFDWETINDYIIKRPWQDVFQIKIEKILDAYKNKGVFDLKIIEKCFKPLFDAKDIPIDINLEDFYKLTNIELHVFSFEVNEYIVKDISYLTFPKLSLLTAIQMTCAIPILISPVCVEDTCFIDGGISCNYPLSYCISSGKNADEILGFKNKYEENKNIINNESNILDFLLGFLFKTISSFNTDKLQPNIKNEIICDAKHLSFETISSALSNIEVRKDLFNKGVQTGIIFINNLENSI